MDLKKDAAREALKFIEEKFTVGLGAGSTVAHLIDLLAEDVNKGLNIKIFTSSFNTRRLLLSKGFAINDVSGISRLDIYFDGCDQLDSKLNALKSGGGIHTSEKLLASMAGAFLLIGDETKYSENFDTTFPLVIELLPETMGFVTAQIQKLFPGTKNIIRMNDKRDGAVITTNGNYLLDVWFTAWPELSQINPRMKEITGVVETSLFYGLAHKAILAGNGEIKILEKRL